MFTEHIGGKPVAKNTLDRKKTRVLRQLDSLNQHIETECEDVLSDWEIEFVESLSERLQDYDSAFSDREKGSKDSPLSLLQGKKLKEIIKKIRDRDAQPPVGAVGVASLGLNKGEPIMAKSAQNVSNAAPKLRLISNPTPPSGEPQAYVPRCARPVRGQTPRLVSVQK